MKRIVIIGGGFAGFWAAAGAARKLDQLGIDPASVDVSLIEKNGYHNIRVRNYESDPNFIIPLPKILDPIGVTHAKGEAIDIDVEAQNVQICTDSGSTRIDYDRLVYAAGSHVFRPDIPGLAEHAFEVDSHTGAKQLEGHLKSLPDLRSEQRYTVLIVGAGLTGIESACEMPERLRKIRDARGDKAPVRVILADSSLHIGSDMGAEARAVITKPCRNSV